jgi:hypothetical protein
VFHYVAVTGDDSTTRIATNVSAAPQRPSEGAMVRSIGSQVGQRIAEIIKSVAEHYDAMMLVRSASTSAASADEAEEQKADLQPAVPV